MCYVRRLKVIISSYKCHRPVMKTQINYKLLISVYDSDNVSSNDFMGRTKIDLDSYWDGVPKETWFSLSAMNHEVLNLMY